MTIREEIDAQFPIRKTTAQKRAFEKWVMAKMREMGYRPYVDGMNRKDKLRHRNIVAGDPQNAELLISAHYDTAATIGIPDLRIPRNFPVYILSQGAVLLGMLLISLLIGHGGRVGDEERRFADSDVLFRLSGADAADDVRRGEQA